MKNFYREVRSRLTQEKEKNPELVAYEEKKSILQAQIMYLKKEYNEYASLTHPGFAMLLSPFPIPVTESNHYDIDQCEKRCALYDRLTRKEQELEKLRVNKPVSLEKSFNDNCIPLTKVR